MYWLGIRGGTPGGRFGGAFPEVAAELRVEDDDAEEGMIEDVVETETVVGATGGAPMEATLRPIARLLTGPRPEGAETVEEPTEDAWGAPSDTCAAPTEEEAGTDEDGTADTEEGKEECRLESPSTLGCNKVELDVRTEDGARLFCWDGWELCCGGGMVLGGRSSLCPRALRDG